MKLRRIVAGAAASVFATFGVLVVTAQPALATTCAGGGALGNYQVGWSTLAYGGSQPSTGIEGSSSCLYTRSTVAICSTDPTNQNFSTSWNMVQDQHGHYAQAGIFRDPTVTTSGPCQLAYSQQWITTGNHVQEHDVPGCLTIGSRHAYRNLMVLTSGTYHVVSSFDGATEQTSAYDPFAQGQWTTTSYGFDIDFDAETVYTNTAVEGVASLPVNYTAMGVQQYDDSLHTTCSHANLGRVNQNNPPHAFEAASDCSDVTTWESGL